MRKMFSYPAVRRAAHSYVKHGVTVDDPYHYLEDADGAETKSFVTAQCELFDQYMADGKALRDRLHQNISKTMDYSKFSAVSKRKRGYYYYFNPGLLNQSVLMQTNALHGAEAVEFLNPNTLSADGTTSLSQTAWSRSEKYYAYSVSEKGSDWNTIYVMDPDTRQLTTDKIEWVKFSGISWLLDDGFFYSRYPVPDTGKQETTAQLRDCALYYHRLGTAQSEDVRVFDLPEHPTYLLSLGVSDDDRYLVLTVFDGCEPAALVYYAEVPANFSEAPARITFLPIVDAFEAEYDLIANDGPRFYFVTTKDAPLKRVVAIDVNEPKKLIPVVHESDAKIDSVGVSGNTLFLVYLRDVKHALFSRSLTGGPDEPLVAIPVPIGQISSLSCRRESPFVSLSVTSFLMPGRILFLDGPESKEVKLFRDNQVEGLNPDDFVVTQVFYDSDGERVPMFVCHHKDVQYDGTNPTVLYGYGGFNISILPSFSASRTVFMRDLRGVFVLANIRGGSEYGKRWHDGGSKFNKMNCYTDFCNAARKLFDMRVTSPEKLAIQGGSNGGLLVAACANLHPELFGAVLCSVGVLDMFKFHEFTIGHAWKSDFGDPEVKEDFEYLQNYSPLHNIKVGVKYPAVLVVTADHDDRVVPAHSLKYLAALQHCNPDTTASGPFLARIDVNAGHGAGKPTSKAIDEVADLYAFLAVTLGGHLREAASEVKATL